MFSDAITNIPKVLIIEKGHGLSAEFSRQLADTYEFYSAASIDEALTVIKEQGIQGILLDIATFGREEGFLGTRRIKATHSNGKLPVIAVLPEADPGMKTDSLLAGCTTFIIQPLSTQGLDVVIAEVLNLTASFRTAAGTRAAS